MFDANLSPSDVSFIPFLHPLPTSHPPNRKFQSVVKASDSSGGSDSSTEGAFLKITTQTHWAELDGDGVSQTLGLIPAVQKHSNEIRVGATTNSCFSFSTGRKKKEALQQRDFILRIKV